MIQAPGVHLSPAGGCQAGDRRPPRRIVAAGSGSGDEHQYQRAQKEKPHETQAKRHQAIDPPWPCAGYSVSFEADDLERGLVNHDAGRPARQRHPGAATEDAERRSAPRRCGLASVPAKSTPRQACGRSCGSDYMLMRLLVISGH